MTNYVRIRGTLAQQEFEPLNLQPAASRYTSYIVPAVLFRELQQHYFHSSHNYYLI